MHDGDFFRGRSLSENVETCKQRAVRIPIRESLNGTCVRHEWEESCGWPGLRMQIAFMTASRTAEIRNWKMPWTRESRAAYMTGIWRSMGSLGIRLVASDDSTYCNARGSLLNGFRSSCCNRDANKPISPDHQERFGIEDRPRDRVVRWCLVVSPYPRALVPERRVPAR